MAKSFLKLVACVVRVDLGLLALPRRDDAPPGALDEALEVSVSQHLGVQLLTRRGAARVTEQERVVVERDPEWAVGGNQGLDPSLASAAHSDDPPLEPRAAVESANYDRRP